MKLLTGRGGIESHVSPACCSCNHKGEGGDQREKLDGRDEGGLKLYFLCSSKPSQNLKHTGIYTRGEKGWGK